MHSSRIFCHLSLTATTLLMIGHVPSSARQSAPSAPTAAAAPSTVPEDDVVVRGVRPDEDRLRDQANAFVRRIAAHPIDDQFARWNDPVCLMVIGLSEEHAATVTQSVARAAASAGAAVAGRGCRPNAVVTFTTQASRLMALLSKRSSASFSQVTQAERSALFGDVLPVRWWYSTRTEGADGRQMSTSSAAMLMMPDVPGPRSGRYLDSYHSSMISTKIRVSLDRISIVVDADAAAGTTLRTLSSYIAMVALAPMRMTTDYTDMPSIMSIFSSKKVETHRDLSTWDVAYLASLYRVPTDRPAWRQRALLANEMLKGVRR